MIIDATQTFSVFSRANISSWLVLHGREDETKIYAILNCMRGFFFSYSKIHVRCMYSSCQPLLKTQKIKLSSFWS